MWETITILAAVAAGAIALILIIRRQAKGRAPGCCGNCPYGPNPSECAPPAAAADVPAECQRLK